jgi:hypothetical protein
MTWDKQQIAEMGMVVKAFHDAIPQRAHSPQNKIGGARGLL